MRSRLRFAVTALAITLGFGVAGAEPIGSHVYVVPMAGATIFDGNIRFPDDPLRDDPYYGGRVGYQWLRWLGFEAGGGFTSSREDNPDGMRISFMHAGLDVKLSPFAGRQGGPYFLLGGGLGQLKPEDGTATLNLLGTQPGRVKQGNLEAGGGTVYWLSDRLGLRLEARDVAWVQKESPTHIVTHTWILGAGLTIAFGAKERDTDGDGVPDSRDKDPNTPRGALVDPNGVPIDTDGDGVYDGLDKDPNTPRGAHVDRFGVPIDSDGDGVYDGLDQCPDTPKGTPVDAKGCPKDSDGDGVLDNLDQCPDTPKGTPVDTKGCPLDTDGDGVPDFRDRCPNTVAGVKVDSLGCEVMSFVPSPGTGGVLRLENVNFETGKSDLLPEMAARLDLAAKVLVDSAGVQIEIGGHTDSRGSAALNQRLSEARARAVRTYLLQKFPTLEAGRFTVKGYGKTRLLVSPDTTEADLARNRRVEFQILRR